MDRAGLLRSTSAPLGTGSDVLALLSMMDFSQATGTLRAFSLAIAISVAANGGGLPLCTSLLAHTAGPCEMHVAHGGITSDQPGMQMPVVAPQTTGQSCHQDDGGLGCAAGSACPTVGLATPGWARVTVDLGTASQLEAQATHSGFVSYSAPPLSPPPQA